MIPNRRRQERRVPDRFAFIQIDRDDGGAVLNVSEEGLSFETFSPVRKNEPIHFWFSLNLKDRIEATGELAWTDESRKIGGLRFLDFSPSAREEVCTWLRLASMTEEPAVKGLSDCTQGFGGSAAHGTEPKTVATWLLRERIPEATRFHHAPASRNSDSASQGTPATFGATQLVPLKRYLSATRRELIRGFLLGVLISSAVSIPAVKYFSNRKQVAASQPATGQRATTGSEAQIRAAAPIPSSEVAHSSSIAPAAGKSHGSMLSSQAPDNPSPRTVVGRRGQSLTPSYTSPPTPLTVQPQLRETKGLKKTIDTPQQLWSSVQTGNSKAALALADLYIRGDGVPVNCDQARVLLLVASEKGNTEAIKKLRELDKSGCATP